MRFWIGFWIAIWGFMVSAPQANVLYQGRIVDHLTEEPLSHVQLRGWYGGHYDDAFSLKDGSFQLDLPQSADSIVISSFGYLRIRWVNPPLDRDRIIRLEIEPFQFPVVEILAGSDRSRTQRLPLSATVITQATLKDMAGLSLSQKLNRLGYYIRDYGGEGGVKAMVVRGNRTTDQLCYLDEINLVNPQNGSADLSSIGSMELQSVEIYQEGLTSILGSGAINAAMKLNSAEQLGTRVSAGIGSFGYYDARVNHGIRVNSRLTAFQTLTWSHSQGNFKYSIPLYGLTRHRRNNDHQLFQFYSRNTLTLSDRDQIRLSGLLIQNDRGLPGLMLSENQSARMAQQNLYLAATWHHQFRPGTGLDQILAYTRLEDQYDDPVTPTFSRHHNRVWRSTTRLNSGIGALKLWSELQLTRESIRSTDTERRCQERLELSLAPQYSRTGILADSDQWMITGGNRWLIRRQEGFYSFYLSNSYQLHSTWAFHLLYLNIARNCRVPTMNERFWNPGGNPDLKNERSTSLSGGYKLVHGIGWLELALFHKTYRDLIQWLPLTSQVWTPKNHQSAYNQGLEITGELDWIEWVRLNAKWTIQEMEATNSSGTYFTPIYFPENLLHLSAEINYRRLSLNYSLQRFPSVFSSPDNTSRLKSFWLHEFGIHLNNKTWACQFQMMNLTNTVYYYYANYPMPGRQFRLALEKKF